MKKNEIFSLENNEKIIENNYQSNPNNLLEKNYQKLPSIDNIERDYLFPLENEEEKIDQLIKGHKQIDYNL